MSRAKKNPLSVPMPADADRHVPTGYIGALVGLQRPAVRAWMDREGVPVTWIAGRRMYRLSDVKEVIERNTIKPATQKGGRP